MNVRFQRDKLQQAFQNTAAVVPSRTPKPILQNVKLTVRDGEAVLNATDSEVWIRHQIAESEITTPGECLLSVARFGAILRESSDEHITLRNNGNQLEVRGARSLFKLPSENPDEFPSAQAFHEEAYFEVSGGRLKELIRRTIFSADPDNSRYALGGVLFEFSDEKIMAVGTDGRRLAYMEVPAKSVGGASSPSTNVVVPVRGANLIERTLGEGDSLVKFAPRENDVLVHSGGTLIGSLLLEGRYPRWRDILENRPKGEDIGLLAGPLLTAIRQAAVVTDNETRGIGLRFGEGNLVIEGSAAQLGESHVELPVSYQGEPLDVDLDNRFVAEFLRALDPQKEVRLNVKDSNSAAEFRTDDGYRYIVMPMARDTPRSRATTAAAAS